MFKYFSWHTAFLGFAGCVAMMFVVDPVFAGVAIILLLLLLITLHYMAPMASWGSISQALIFHQVRKYLLLLDSRKEHVKFWRPQILLLVSNPRNCTPLLDLVNDLKKSGLYVIGHVKKGKMDNLTMDPISEEIPFWLGLVDYLNLKAFVELTMAPAIRDGVAHLIRMAGIGAMKPNTVILGFHDSESAENTFERSELWKSIKFAKLERAEIQEFFEEMRENFRQLNGVEYVQIIHDALRMNKNVCLARGFAKFDKEAIFRASRNTPQYIGKNKRKEKFKSNLGKNQNFSIKNDFKFMNLK